MEKKSILNWLNQLSEDGNELIIGWEGGGDSGWCYFKIDGDSVENEYTEALVDYMYSALDYGSWAGEFNANGEAVYDHEKRTFEGTDYYSEDSYDHLESNIKIQVPKSFWFNTLHIECEKYHDDNTNISARFLVTNGFLTDQHTDFCTNLEETLREDFDAVFDQYESTDDFEFRGCNDSWVLERKDAVEEGDMLVFTINKVEIQTMESTDKDIVLEITDELIESIDEKLNEK
jgi:hypothetical protein